MSIQIVAVVQKVTKCKSIVYPNNSSSLNCEKNYQMKIPKLYQIMGGRILTYRLGFFFSTWKYYLGVFGQFLHTFSI